MDKKRLVSVLLNTLLILALLYSFSSLINNTGPSKIEKLEYSGLIDQINNGNISEITIRDDGHISGKFLKPVSEKTEFESFGLNPDTHFVENIEKELRGKNPIAVVKTEKYRSDPFINFLLEWGPMLLIMYLIYFFIFRKMQGGNPMQFMKNKTRLASDNSKKTTFADVAGIDEAKDDLQEIIEFLREPKKFQKLGARIPRGVLLVGPPGTGKTLLARAIAGEAHVPFFSISGSDFVEMFVGVGAGRVRDLFDQGKKNAPCIIFIDEIDAVAKQRGSGLGNNHDEREQTLNQLLIEMDGFENNSGIILIAATNRPDVLDPALMRPGRFDRRVMVGNPDVGGRLAILKVHSKNIPLDEKTNLDKIARGTPGCSGADLANLVNEAALLAAKNNKTTVGPDDFEKARDKTLMGSERRSMIISEKEKKTTAYHEAGHAIVAARLPETDPLHKVTIIPRGLSLGSTSQLPENDIHNYSKVQLESQLAILMAGRVAEEIFLERQITTGASNDIERATDIARRMICEWGMSDSLGPIKFGTESVQPFLGRRLSDGGQNYSEETAQKIDAEIERLIEDAYHKAESTLMAMREALIATAHKLMEVETLDGEDIRKIIEESTKSEVNT